MSISSCSAARSEGSASGPAFVASSFGVNERSFVGHDFFLDLSLPSLSFQAAICRTVCSGYPSFFPTSDDVAVGCLSRYSRTLRFFSSGDSSSGSGSSARSNDVEPFWTCCPGASGCLGTSASAMPTVVTAGSGGSSRCSRSLARISSTSPAPSKIPKGRIEAAAL